NMERLVPGFRQVIAQLLDARFVRYLGILVRRARRRFRGVFAALTVYLVQMFRLGVIGLHLVVTDRPRRRHAAMVLQFAKIFLAQTEQGGPVKLGISAHVVVGVWMQVFTVLVMPLLVRVVLGVDVDGFRTPVVFLARHVVAALQYQDAFAGRRQMIGQRSSAGSCANDDYVITIVRRHATPRFVRGLPAGIWVQLMETKRSVAEATKDLA